VESVVNVPTLIRRKLGMSVEETQAKNDLENVPAPLTFWTLGRSLFVRRTSVGHLQTKIIRCNIPW